MIGKLGITSRIGKTRNPDPGYGKPGIQIYDKENLGSTSRIGKTRDPDPG